MQNALVLAHWTMPHHDTSGYGNPGYGYPGYGGPTTIYRDKKHGTSVYTGPNGTTVCREINGNVTVCN